MIEENLQPKTVANFFAPWECKYRLLYSKNFIMEGVDVVALNPKGYVKWFLQQCNKSGGKTQRRMSIQDMAIQEPIKQLKQKSEL